MPNSSRCFQARGGQHRTAALFVLLLCWGCASGGESPEMEPAPLPIYKIGDRFLYDDGLTEEVIGIEDDRITWQRRTGSTFVRYRNLALPNLEWDFRKRKGEARVTAAADALWPLEVGREVTFAHEVDSTSKENGTTRSYGQGKRCWVDGTESLTVPAGDFDTYRIVCEQWGVSRRSRSRNRLQTWYYAPALGHYVMAVQEGSRGRPKVRSLVAYEFPEMPDAPAASRNLDELTQRTLETRLSGERVEWVDSERGRSVEITPTETRRRSDGQACRRYTLTIRMASRTETKQAEACRWPTGRWERELGPGPRRLFPEWRFPDRHDAPLL